MREAAGGALGCWQHLLGASSLPIPAKLWSPQPQQAPCGAGVWAGQGSASLSGAPGTEHHMPSSPEQQKSTFSWLWRLEAGGSRLLLPRPLWGASSRGGPYVLVCVLVPLPKDSGHIGLGATLLLCGLNESATTIFPNKGTLRPGGQDGVTVQVVAASETPRIDSGGGAGGWGLRGGAGAGSEGWGGGWEAGSGRGLRGGAGSGSEGRGRVGSERQVRGRGLRGGAGTERRDGGGA